MKKVLIALFIFVSIIIVYRIIYVVGAVKKFGTTRNEEFISTIDYTDIKVLDSLIKNVEKSTDTIFLGLRMGMTKNEYNSHIKALKKEGYNIKFENNLEYYNPLLEFRSNLGSGYMYYTDIVIEENGKKILGKGEYFLEPIFNNNKLERLNIVKFEKYSEDKSSSTPGWLDGNVFKYTSTVDKNFKDALVAIGETESYHDVGYKSNNTVVYNTFLGVAYVDKRALYSKMLDKQHRISESQDNNNDIKF